MRTVKCVYVRMCLESNPEFTHLNGSPYRRKSEPPQLGLT